MNNAEVLAEAETMKLVVRIVLGTVRWALVIVFAVIGVAAIAGILFMLVVNPLPTLKAIAIAGGAIVAFLLIAFALAAIGDLWDWANS